MSVDLELVSDASSIHSGFSRDGVLKGNSELNSDANLQRFVIGKEDLNTWNVRLTRCFRHEPSVCWQARNESRH